MMVRGKNKLIIMLEITIIFCVITRNLFMLCRTDLCLKNLDPGQKILFLTLPVGALGGLDIKVVAQVVIYSSCTTNYIL